MRRLVPIAGPLSLIALPAHAQSAPASNFVEMRELQAPIVDAGRLDGILRVSIVLQARDSAAASAIANRMPELRAAGLGAAIEFARLRASPYAPVDVAILSEMLTAALTQGAKDIARVLIVRVTATAG